MRKASRKNIFSRYLVGKEKVKFNIIHHANNTLFIGETSLRNVLTIKCIMCHFELASNLIVSFLKSSFGIFGGGGKCRGNRC